MLGAGQPEDGRQGRQRCQETQHFQMIREEEIMRLLVWERKKKKNCSNSCQGNFFPSKSQEEGDKRKGSPLAPGGRQEKRSKDEDGSLGISCLFDKQPPWEACAEPLAAASGLWDPPVQAGKPVHKHWGLESRMSPLGKSHS